MSRPQQLSSPSQHPNRIWVIAQLHWMLWLPLLAFIAISPIHCDSIQQKLSSPVALPSHPVTFAAGGNDKLLHRVARLTKVQDDAAVSPKNASEARVQQLPHSAAAFLASNGLRTLLKPQKFYTKQQRFATNGNLVSMDLVTEPRKDICNGHCQCEKKNAFTTVTCDYQRNPKLSQILDKSFKLPELTSAVVIRLGHKTQFLLQEGFFSNDTVNGFMVEGHMSDGEKVEIGPNAFLGNNGPYPQIAFNNVFTVVIGQKSFQQKVSAAVKFNVTNSNEVLLFENAFENTQIRGSFEGIKDLRIYEKAFSSAQAKLHIESSNIDNIYRFDASIREIKFVNCTIGIINPGAFDVNNINSIIFESCRIDAIKSRAITEKLYSDLVSITGASIGLIESDAIYGSGIKELKITNNKIDTIHENAIYVTSIYVTISDNNIKHLGSKWLHVKDWRRITVKGNRFGVFGHMYLENSKSRELCTFEGNSLTDPQDGSLNFTQPYCKIREISVNNVCRCDFKWLERLSDHDLKSEIYCTIDDKLSQCYNTTVLNFLMYFNEICDESKTSVNCKNNRNLKRIEGRFFTPEELAAKSQQLPQLIIILVVAVLLLIVIIVLVIVVACRIRKQKSKLGRSGQSPGRSHLHEFSQEERLVIDQSLQMIQKKYPEIYKKVNDRFQVLFIQNLSEDKCVKTVSEILNLLDKVKNPGNDFIILNRLLTQHLQSPLPTAPPPDQTPIYSEPGLTEMDEGFYAANSFAQLQSTPGLASPGTGTEHIYAEPSCAQQPLLPNEYASPADGHLTSMDVYTEPINERGTNLTTPYAVTAPLNRPAYQSPYRPVQYAATSRHQYPYQQRQLPDVLSQQTPQPNATNAPASGLSNVRRMAQDLQGKSNFNPIAKPRNLHLVTPPTYTAPDVRHKRPLVKSSNSSIPAPSDDIELDMRGAAALPLPNTDSRSNHSGGSNETVEMDDIIEYADS